MDFLKALKNRAMGEQSAEWETAPTRLAGELPSAARAARMRPMNVLERLLFGETPAVAYPTRTVTYNAKAARKLGVPVDDIMSHELKHIEQFGQMNPARRLFEQFNPFTALTPIEKRPHERAAMDQELTRQGRRNRTGDVRLK